jgi:serine/threonine protein kinase
MTWKSLSHPNVLPLLGVTMSGKHFAMVSEWMANGSINEFIKANPDANRFKLVGCPSYLFILSFSPPMVSSDSSKGSPED